MDVHRVGRYSLRHGSILLCIRSVSIVPEFTHIWGVPERCINRVVHPPLTERAWRGAVEAQAMPDFHRMGFCVPKEVSF
jgi:hypothetical protein